MVRQLGWVDYGLRCSTIYTAKLLSYFCQFPNSSGGNRKSAEDPKSKSAQPYCLTRCPALYIGPNSHPPLFSAVPVPIAVLLLLPPQRGQALLLLRRLNPLLGQLPHPGEARQLHRLHRLQLQSEAAATTAGGDI